MVSGQFVHCHRLYRSQYYRSVDTVWSTNLDSLVLLDSFLDFERNHSIHLHTKIYHAPFQDFFFQKSDSFNLKAA